MLSKKEECFGVYFLHYVLFYALLVAYVALTSCSGVREELIPHTNEAIVNMDESGKAAYRQLVAMLTKGEGEVFDQIVRGVKDPKRLSIVLQQMLENLLKDFELLKLLPKPRRVACRQALIKAQATEKQPGLFDQYKPNLKRINAFPPEYKALIIALFEMLPDDQAVACYNALGNPASVAQAEQLIASKLPASSLQQLKGDAKEKFLKLSESKQQEVFKMVSSLPPSQVDLIELVEQKRDKDLKEKKAIPTDPFGDGLPLEGEERKKFVDVVFGFGKMEDIRAAVDLFNAVEKPSIKNFIDAYSSYFSEKPYKKVELGKDGRKRDVETSERRELLATIICLYKRNKSMTIELCNYPERFEGIAKLKLGWYTTVAQREILSQLKKALEKIDREHALRQHKT